MPDQIITGYTVTVVGSAVCATAAILLWLTREFSKTRNLFYRVISRHNREDDERFSHLDDQQWSIIVRNAIKDGERVPERRTMRRRRYLVDDSGDEEGGGAEMEPRE